MVSNCVTAMERYIELVDVIQSKATTGWVTRLPMLFMKIYLLLGYNSHGLYGEWWILGYGAYILVYTESDEYWSTEHIFWYFLYATIWNLKNYH